MKKLSLIIIILCSHHIYSQEKTLHTKTNVISIQDGKYLYKNKWIINPNLKLDIYYPLLDTNKKNIIFMSDIDTISFNVKKNKTYYFNIVDSNGKVAKTQLNLSEKRKPTFNSLPIQLKFNNNQKTDTIKFKLVNNAIFLKLKINNYDKELTFLFDTGANGNVLSIPLDKKIIQFTDTTTNEGATGKHQVLLSDNDNTITLNNILIKNVDFIKNDYDKQEDFDGILGYHNFQNYIIQIDFDKKQMIISDKMPKNLKGYDKSKIDIVEEMNFIPLKINFNEDNDIEIKANFDTGSDSYLFVDKKVFSKIKTKPQKIGTAEITGSSGVVSYLTSYLLPTLKVGKFELYNTDIDVPNYYNKYNENNLGCGIIKRFNWVLDFQKTVFYYKPNSHIYDCKK